MGFQCKCVQKIHWPGKWNLLRTFLNFAQNILASLQTGLQFLVFLLLTGTFHPSLSLHTLKASSTALDNLILHPPLLTRLQRAEVGGFWSRQSANQDRDSISFSLTFLLSLITSEPWSLQRIWRHMLHWPVRLRCLLYSLKKLLSQWHLTPPVSFYLICFFTLLLLSFITYIIKWQHNIGSCTDCHKDSNGYIHSEKVHTTYLRLISF